MQYLGRDFPEWRQLVAEAREVAGANPSESVNWKQYAFGRYGLPITDPAGVREIVRNLDLAGVKMPSLEKVVEQLVTWASQLPAV
jgi:hypothetical protein